MAKNKPEENKGSIYDFLHLEMIRHFHEWEDELFLRNRGYKITDLLNLQGAIARYDSIVRRNPDNDKAREELDRMRKKYDEVWLPRIFESEKKR